MLRIWEPRKKQCNEPEEGKHLISNVESILKTTNINPRYTKEPVVNILINTTLTSSDGQIPGSSTATKFAIPRTNSLPARKLVIYDRPLLVRRVRPTAMDFYSEEDESTGPEEYLRLNEPIASSGEEKQRFAACSGLYRCPAQVAASGSINDGINAATVKVEGSGCDTHKQTERQEQQDTGEDSLTLSSQECGQHQYLWQQDIGVSKSSSSQRQLQQQDAGADFPSLFLNQQYWKRQKCQQQASRAGSSAFPPNQWHQGHQKSQQVTGESSSRLSTDRYWWQENSLQKDILH